MVGFIEGRDRTQSALFPEQLDDWIHEDSTVRVIDVFIDGLDLKKLGFDRAQPAATGRPGYRPTTLLKIYVYGYLNRVQSSRRLEAEAQRNIELIWLTGRLAPDFKTIADFRRDNGEAIGKVCKELVLLCRRLKLFTDGIVAIDGSKFKAVNNRDKNFTDRKLEARIEQLEDSIKRYLVELDRADRDAAAVLPSRVEHLKEKIGKVKQQIEALNEIGKQMKASEDGQISLTDPDARSMATSGRGTGIVGYNVQAAVDAKHHLIVAHEVTNVGHDRNQLAHMAKLAQAATGQDDLIAVADKGYYEGHEILDAELAGVAVVVPKPMTSNNAAKGLFDKRDFVYDDKADQYRCPAGSIAIHRMTTEEAGKIQHKYWSSDCSGCAMKPRCTTSKERRISRWEHEDILDVVQQRLDGAPQAMTLRRQTVEHVFGTLKAWMGSTHFLTKKLPRVRTEMNLQVLAYNLKRTIKILGTGALIGAMRA
ncbi:IS1182 family transposase [Pseudaquabacterium pictum]|uniref:DDE transposase n=1 Tax=Pseudaquabacterium pictum TaxID=2315236 RepID=A0A480AX81_9BURK|nr:IS1182 family transposase [Rubrivivax pictus]GCL65496.1 DDE transposase [Rubrivivax pictus]